MDIRPLFPLAGGLGRACVPVLRAVLAGRPFLNVRSHLRMWPSGGRKWITGIGAVGLEGGRYWKRFRGGGLSPCSLRLLPLQAELQGFEELF